MSPSPSSHNGLEIWGKGGGGLGFKGQNCKESIRQRGGGGEGVGVLEKENPFHGKYGCTMEPHN